MTPERSRASVFTIFMTASMWRLYADGMEAVWRPRESRRRLREPYSPKTPVRHGFFPL